MSINQTRNFASYLSYFCACLFLLTGCGSKQSEAEKAETESDARVAADDVLSSLRSSQVTDLVKFGDESFSQGLLNDVSRTDQYLKSGNKGVSAANLGVYLSDMSCLVSHDKRDDANRYFQSCLTLSESVGMKKQFGQAVQLHFNDIIKGDTTLSNSVETLFKDAANTAEQEEFKKLHAAALAGYYIEELYLLASFIKSRHANQDSIFFATLGVFASQKDELGNLINYFDHVQLKSAGHAVYQELLTLQEKYWIMDTDRFWSLQETNPDRVLQDKSLQDVFEVLTSIRQRIVAS